MIYFGTELCYAEEELDDENAAVSWGFDYPPVNS